MVLSQHRYKDTRCDPSKGILGLLTNLLLPPFLKVRLGGGNGHADIPKSHQVTTLLLPVLGYMVPSPPVATHTSAWSLGWPSVHI